MILNYEKRSLEIVIRKTHGSALQKLRKLLRKDYRDIFQKTLTSCPGGKDVLQMMDNDLNTWANGYERTGEILAVLMPKESSEHIFVLRLRTIDSLATSFGKKYHNKGYGHIIVCVFSTKKDDVGEVSRFYKLLAKHAATAFSRKKTPVISHIAYINEKTSALAKKKNNTPIISARITEILNLLKEQRFRNTLLRTKQAKDPTLDNIAKSTGMSVDEARIEIDHGLKNKILQQQFNVICLSCRTPMSRVKKKSAVAQMVRSGVECPKCNKQLTVNSFEECYSVENSVKKLLEGSKWMCMYVRLHLDKYDFIKCIMTEVIDGPNEIDLVANVDGELLLMELKDSRFSIGHAYSFVGKCSQYNPEIAVICSTEGVDDDVKEYIKNTGINAHYIEKIEELNPCFEEIFSKKNEKVLTSLLLKISWNSLLTQSILSKFDVISPATEEKYSAGFSWPEGTVNRKTWPTL